MIRDKGRRPGFEAAKQCASEWVKKAAGGALQIHIGDGSPAHRKFGISDHQQSWGYENGPW